MHQALTETWQLDYFNLDLQCTQKAQNLCPKQFSAWAWWDFAKRISPKFMKATLPFNRNHPSLWKLINVCIFFHKTGIRSILVFVKSINGHLAKFSVPSISKVFEKIHSGAEPVTRFQTTKCHQSKFLWLIQFLCKGLRNSCSIVPKFDNTKKSPNKYIKKKNLIPRQIIVIYNFKLMYIKGINYIRSLLLPKKHESSQVNKFTLVFK